MDTTQENTSMNTSSSPEEGSKGALVGVIIIIILLILGGLYMGLQTTKQGGDTLTPTDDAAGTVPENTPGGDAVSSGLSGSIEAELEASNPNTLNEDISDIDSAL